MTCWDGASIRTGNETAGMDRRLAIRPAYKPMLMDLTATEPPVETDKA
jgi:hypothetical protein